MNKYLSEKLKAISFILMVMVVILHSYNLEVKLDSKIVLVDAGLNSFIQNFICKGITTIAVPLFFIISGYLFFLNIKNGSLIEFIAKYKKRIKTLVLPYLIWSIYGLLFVFILQTIPISRPFFYNALIFDYSFSQLLTTIFIHPIPYQLWFIRDLIILIFLTPLWYKLLTNIKHYVLLLFLITWFIEFNFILFSHEALLFFLAGGYLGLNKISLQHFNFKKKSLLFVMAWLMLTFTETMLLHLNYQQEWVIIAVHKVEILTGIIALWGIYDFYFEGKKKDISSYKVYFLFQFSFFLYAFHEPVLSIFRKGLNKLIGHSEIESFTIFLIAPTLTILTSIILGYYIKKITPKLYFLLTGGR